MANPYKKEKQGVAPGGAPKPVVKEEPVIEEKPVQENPFNIEIEKKPKGKAYSFYLDVEAQEKLEKFAKQNKCTKSKALNALLHKLPD